MKNAEEGERKALNQVDEKGLLIMESLQTGELLRIRRLGH